MLDMGVNCKAIAGQSDSYHPESGDVSIASDRNDKAGGLLHVSRTQENRSDAKHIEW